MKNKNGISILEIIIGMFIFSLISVLAIGIYTSHFKVYSNQNSHIDVASQSKIGIDEIVNQIRQSQSIVNTCSACGSDITSSTVLVLQLWPLDTNGDPKDPTTNDYDYIVYKKNPADLTQITRRILPNVASNRQGSTTIIANNVSSLNFAYNNGTPSATSQVTITVITSKLSFGKTQTSTQVKNADLRNK